MTTTYSSGSSGHDSMLILKARSSLILAFGVFLIVLGLLALGSVLTATLVTVYYVGMMMLLGGLGEVFIAFQVRGWRGFLFWIALGLLSTIAGFVAFSNPTLAAGVLTLVLGLSLVVAGLVRLFIAFHMRRGSPWGLMILSGALTILVGLIILSEWPTSSLYTLGLFLGIDLLLSGLSWLNVGWVLRRLEID